MEGGINLSYVSKLNELQIRELCEIYTSNFAELEYKISKDYIDIKLRDSEGLQDSYVFRDFNVSIFDWMSNDEFELLKMYRSKMLLWFGNQYAIDFLYHRA